MIRLPTPTSYSVGESNLLNLRCSTTALSFIPLAGDSYHKAYQFFGAGNQLIDFNIIKLIDTVFHNRCFKNAASKIRPYAPLGVRSV